MWTSHLFSHRGWIILNNSYKKIPPEWFLGKRMKEWWLAAVQLMADAFITIVPFILLTCIVTCLAVCFRQLLISISTSIPLLMKKNSFTNLRQIQIKAKSIIFFFNFRISLLCIYKYHFCKVNSKPQKFYVQGDLNFRWLDFKYSKTVA